MAIDLFILAEDQIERLRESLETKGFHVKMTGKDLDVYRADGNVAIQVKFDDGDLPGLCMVHGKKGIISRRRDLIKLCEIVDEAIIEVGGINYVDSIWEE